MTENINLNELEDIPAEAITEEIADKYNPTKVKVKSVVTGTCKSYWKNAARLPDGQFEIVPCVTMETEVFGTDAKGQPLSAKIDLKLQKSLAGKWGFSTGQKSTGRKVLKMLKINNIQEAVGKEVVVVKTVGGKSGRPFLVISIPN